GDDQIRFEKHRQGDDDPLRHAAAQLVDVASYDRLWLVDPYLLEQRKRSGPTLRPAEQPSVGATHQFEVTLDREDWMERAEGILADVGDPFAPDPTQPSI